MNKTRILVVDDEPEILRVFGLVLGSAGYEVWMGSTGRDCLKLAREKKPDIILLDVLLPDLNGMELCKQIKGDTDLRDIFVVLISGDATDPAHKVEGLESGADDYIVKPLEPDELLARIRTIVRLKDTIAALRASEEHHRRLIEILPDAVCLVDPEGRLLAVNSQAVEILGYASPEELLQKSAFDLAPIEEHGRIRADIKATLQSGIIRDASYTFLRRDGIPLYVELSARVSHGANRESDGLIIVAHDVTERKLAELSLRESEALSQRIINTTEEGFWMVDLEGNIVDVNEAYCRMSGYSREELLDMSIPDLEVIESSAELVANHMRYIIKSGSDRFETRHRRKNGQTFDLEVIATSLRLRELYIFAFLRDITERKQTDRALRASEERFRELADNIREVFWMSNPEKNEIAYISPAYEEIWGRTCESLHASPRDWVEAIHPDDRERVLEAALTKQISGEYDEEYRIVRPDGLIRWIQDRAFPVRDGSGKVYRIVGIAEDITQRKQAEQAMRRAEARYRSIFENATEGIFRTTPEGRILIANPALARMYGYSSPQEMISSVTDVGRQLYVSPEKRAEMKSQVLKHGSVQGFEEENCRKDGSIIWVSLNAHLVRDASGAVQYFEGTLQDITERKWVERLLQTQRDFGTFLSSSIDLSAAATRLLELALQNGGIDCAGVFLVDPETKALDLVAHQGFSADFAKHASHFSADPAEGRAIGKDNPAFSGHAGGPVAGIVLRLKHENLSAMEVLPVQHSGEVVAVLGVGSHVCTEIPVKTRQALELIAAQAAGAITRIRVERSLRANRRLLERTLHSLPSAVLVLNAGMMVIQECNPAATRMFGYSRDELIGRTINTLHVNKALVKQFASDLRVAVEDKGHLTDCEFKMKHRNGTVFPTEQSMMPIRNEAGQLVNWVSVVQDITERKRAEQELRQLHRRIIEAQETERLRVARELHDGVNQVIASVKMRLRKLEGGGGRFNPADREILTRCDKLLVQALEENRRIAYNLRPSDLDELGLAAACRNFCEEVQARTDLTIQCRITPVKRRLPPALELNLFRIVQEAMVNVEKHARANAVQMRLSFQDHSVVLKIKDDGRGFAPRRPRTGGEKWRGLGLTNMRQRALSLGGSCEVVSAPGAGTTVTVRIPLKYDG